MGPEQLLQLAGQFGPVGLLVGYLIWDKKRDDDKWLDHEKQRLVQDQARTDTDKAVALAMQGLTLAINAMTTRRRN